MVCGSCPHIMVCGTSYLQTCNDLTNTIYRVSLIPWYDILPSFWILNKKIYIVLWVMTLWDNDSWRCGSVTHNVIYSIYIYLHCGSCPTKLYIELILFLHCGSCRQFLYRIYIFFALWVMSHSYIQNLY